MHLSAIRLQRSRLNVIPISGPQSIDIRLGRHIKAHHTSAPAAPACLVLKRRGAHVDSIQLLNVREHRVSEFRRRRHGDRYRVRGASAAVSSHGALRNRLRAADPDTVNLPRAAVCHGRPDISVLVPQRQRTRRQLARERLQHIGTADRHPSRAFRHAVQRHRPPASSIDRELAADVAGRSIQ